MGGAVDKGSSGHAHLSGVQVEVGLAQKVQVRLWTPGHHMPDAEEVNAEQVELDAGPGTQSWDAAGEAAR